MAKPIPKWVQERLALLWKKYGEKEMTFEMIQKVLIMDDRNTISVFLNELKSADWVTIEPSKKDARKRVYVLKNPQEIFMEIKSDENQRDKG